MRVEYFDKSTHGKFSVFHHTEDLWGNGIVGGRQTTDNTFVWNKGAAQKVFIDEMEYKKSPTEYVLRKELYREYRNYCNEEGFKAVSNTNFIERLEAFGCQIEKKNVGNVVFVTKPFC